MEENNEILILNTTAVSTMCSQYNEKIKTIENSYENLSSDFEAFLNCGVLSSYIPDLKESLDKVVLAIESVLGNVKNFAEEQEKIDNRSYDYRSGKSSTSEESIDELELLSNEDINALFNNDEFMEALLSIVKENPDILSNSELSELLKELLLSSGIKDENILKIIEETDSLVLQTTLSKIIDGEISLPEENDMLENIKMVILASLVSNNNSALESNTESESEIIEGGKYVNRQFTASNGVEINYYVYVPKRAGDEEIPMHLFLWPTRSQGPFGYFNVHSLPALLRQGQDASGIVICPRLEANEKYSNSKMKALKELMDQYAKTYNVDENRISVSGQGGGGQAAINIAAKYPNYFSKVAGVYSSGATSDYTQFANSTEEANENIATNDILLIKSRGGGAYLNERSEKYTNNIYNKLKDITNIEVIDNPKPGDCYGHYLYQDKFTYNGKTYTNFLEYMFAQTK